MPTDSANHDLTRHDPADAPPCEMERLADRFCDCPAPKFLKRDAWRTFSGFTHFELSGELQSRDAVVELINFLWRVHG